MYRVWHIYLWTAETDCRDGEIRLADGNVTAGRVEYCSHGVWGAVCDNNWDINDARVICRQLGLPSDCEEISFSNSGPFVFIHLLHVVPQALNGSKYGAGDGPKILNNLHCIGDEVSIEDCLMISGVDHHSCGSEEVASVVCSNGT